MAKSIYKRIVTEDGHKLTVQYVEQEDKVAVSLKMTEELEYFIFIDQEAVIELHEELYRLSKKFKA